MTNTYEGLFRDTAGGTCPECRIMVNLRVSRKGHPHPCPKCEKWCHDGIGWIRIENLDKSDCECNGRREKEKTFREAPFDTWRCPECKRLWAYPPTDMGDRSFDYLREWVLMSEPHHEIWE